MKSLRDWPRLSLFGFVIMAMTLGGGPGELNLNFWLIAIAGLALLVATSLRGGLADFQRMPLLVRLAVALSVALPFLQLIPLPPALGHMLPGHELRLEVLASFNLDQAWMPLSISPAETAYSAMIGLCMFGLFIACLGLSPALMRQLLWCVAIVLLVGVFVGIVQFVTNGSTFDFYSISHKGLLIGFFANKNHMGLMLASLVPILYILNEERLRVSEGGHLLFAIGCIVVLALVVATNSRAGLGMTLFAIALLAFRRFPKYRLRVGIALAAATVLLAGAIATVPAVRALFERVGDAQEDLRVNLAEQAMPLVGQYGILGGGLGSFPALYPPTEKLEWVTPEYVNHVHNDYVELVIEAGIPGLVVLALWAIFLVSARMEWARQAGKPVAGDDYAAFAWMGLIIVLLFAAHSLVDYPVRRVATLTVLVVALASVCRFYAPPPRMLRLPARSSTSGGSAE